MTDSMKQESTTLKIWGNLEERNSLKFLGSANGL